VTVVVGVDGAGRTHRLGEIAAAAQLEVVRIDGHGGAGAELAQRLASATPGGCLVVVDDAHELSGEALQRLAAVARSGVAMAISRRPTVDRPELAELDEAVAAHGPVEQLGRLDDRALAELVSGVTGGTADPELVASVRAASAGHPAVAAAVAGAPPHTPSPALVARLQRRLARLEPLTAELARVLALRLELTDEVLITAVGMPASQLGPAMRSLRDAGLLVPGDEQMIPAVAQAVLADLAAAQRRRLHDRIAVAMVTTGGDPVAAAQQLSNARARTGQAAEIYRAAADRLRFDDPAAALSWYDDALDAGAEPAVLAAGRAEAAALLGRPIDLADPPAGSPDAARFTLAGAAAVAHQGRLGRAADALLAVAPPGPVLAGPSLVAVGRLAQAREAAAGTGPLALRRFAEAALAVGEPITAVPLLIEAAEAVDASPPALVLPDTPHAVGAVVAVTAGDLVTAELLLERAIAGGVGGPVAMDRHRVLLAWARMRTGRYDTALAELRRLDGAALTGRDLLLVAALSAGIARRCGDIARLREAWAGAEPVLARQAVDLFQLEPLEELLVAAARLRQHHRVTPVLDTLAAIVDGLGRPAGWAVSVGWIQLQLAVSVEDVPAAAQAAHELALTAEATTGAGPRQLAQLAAARQWARVLAGEVEPEPVTAASDQLAAVQLPWEGSRLAGHAAIRTADPAAARRLLERAREFASLDPVTVAGRPDTSYGGLSDRELEVARLVLDGCTYREIGAQLYLSPKTVEHHVARVRTKLGAGSRAELVAALRRILGAGPAPDQEPTPGGQPA
jgi:DNA-binding CsgD family transcriptional regulator